MSDLDIRSVGNDVIISIKDTGDELIITDFADAPENYVLQIGEETLYIKDNISDTVNTYISGTEYSDYMLLESGKANIAAGGNGDDFLIGGTESDYIFGDSGNDRITANNGDDVIFGGSGNDSLFGENGNDYISGGQGDDYINGGDGDDIIDSGAETTLSTEETGTIHIYLNRVTEIILSWTLKEQTPLCSEMALRRQV